MYVYLSLCELCQYFFFCLQFTTFNKKCSLFINIVSFNFRSIPASFCSPLCPTYLSPCSLSLSLSSTYSICPTLISCCPPCFSPWSMTCNSPLPCNITIVTTDAGCLPVWHANFSRAILLTHSYTKMFYSRDSENSGAADYVSIGGAGGPSSFSSSSSSSLPCTPPPLPPRQGEWQDPDLSPLASRRIWCRLFQAFNKKNINIQMFSLCSCLILFKHPIRQGIHGGHHGIRIGQKGRQRSSLLAGGWNWMQH